MIEKYYIGYELPNQHKESSKDISGYLASTYGIQDVFDRYEPHFTLKVPFETHIGHILELEEWLPKFCKGRNPIKLTLDGFSHFNIGVIYRDILQHTSELTDLQKELCDGLEMYDWMTFDQIEPNGIPHVTVAIGDIRGRFKAIFQDLKNQFPDEEEFMMDRIHLFEKENRKWQIRKEFLFT